MNNIGLTRNGSLHSTDSKQLLKVIKVDLAKSRNKELLYDGVFNEIVFNQLDFPVKINFVDVENRDMDVSILRLTGIVTEADKLWLTNAAAKGVAEILIWG